MVSTINRFKVPLLELAGAAGGGLVAGALGAGLSQALVRLFLVSGLGDLVNNFGDLVGAILGAGIGYPFGVAAGIHLMRRRLRRPDAFWLALAGAGLGAALVLALVVVLRIANTPGLVLVLHLGTPPISALAVVRRWTKRA